MRPRRGATDLAGVLPVDKPAGMTSHDVVNALRFATGERRIGHAGTLDPMATGLLLVLLGRATRLEPYLVGHDKTYRARIAFGTATDTLDADGVAVETARVPDSVRDAAWAKRVLDGFLGRQQQMPPAYSAIKRDGVAAHRLARAGQTPALKPREIVVRQATLVAVDAEVPAWDVIFEVSKGTYVRSLAADIGRAAGTVAHLGALRRTRVGEVDVETAAGLDDAIASVRAGDLASIALDPVVALELPAVVVEPAAVADGRSLAAPEPHLPEDALVAAITDSELLGIYRHRGDRFVPETVFAPGVPR